MKKGMMSEYMGAEKYASRKQKMRHEKSESKSYEKAEGKKLNKKMKK